MIVLFLDVFGFPGFKNKKDTLEALAIKLYQIWIVICANKEALLEQWMVQAIFFLLSYK